MPGKVYMDAIEYNIIVKFTSVTDQCNKNP